MLLREFLERDIQGFLDGLTIAHEGTVDIAAQQELQDTLNTTMVDESTQVRPAGQTPLPAQQPQVVQQIIQQVQPAPQPVQAPTPQAPAQQPMQQPAPQEQPTPQKNFALPRDNTQVGIHFNKDAGSEMFDPMLNSSLQQDNKLRNTIRDELSHGGVGSNQGGGFGGSPIRNAIQNELDLLGLSGGVTKDTLKSFKSMVHEEFEKRMKELRDLTKDKIHIDEDLLTHTEPEEVEEPLITIKRKDPQTKTKREELSELAKLEDLLVQVKIAFRNNEIDKAKRYYVSIKRRAPKLTFFNNEKMYLLSQLKLLSTQLFNDGDKVDLGGATIDPFDFSDLDESFLNKKVFHEGEGAVFTDRFTVPRDKVFVKTTPQPRTPAVFSAHSPAVVHRVYEVGTPIERQKLQDLRFSKVPQKKFMPQNIKPTRSLEHNKQYLKAVKAIREQNKDQALDLLVELANHYPQSKAIKIRLMEAANLG